MCRYFEVLQSDFEVQVVILELLLRICFLKQFEQLQCFGCSVCSHNFGWLGSGKQVFLGLNGGGSFAAPLLAPIQSLSGIREGFLRCGNRGFG